MLVFALSVTDQVERFGAYAGLAAFLAVAVLTVLLFAQARELKRLRDWAGRAPERAQELEARVLADVSQRRVTAVPRATPAPVAATPTAADPQALADAEASSAPVAGTDAADTAPTEVTAAVGEGEGAEAASEGAGAAAGDPAVVTPAATGGDAEAAGAADAPATEDTDTATAADGDREAQPVGATVAASTAAGLAAAGAGTDVLEPDTGEDETGAASVSVTGPSVMGSAARAGGGLAPATQRARLSTQAPVRTRPAAAAPLRQAGAPSARRPGQIPPYGAPRTRPGDDRRGPAGRTLALLGVGLVALVVAGGFAIFALGGEDAAPRPNLPGDPSLAIEGSPTTPAETTATTDREGEATPAARADTTVAVLNGTVSTGLAATVADKVIAGGWAKGTVDNYTIDQARSATTVYFASGARDQARQLARALSVSAVEPVDEPTQALAPESQVVVVVGADQTP